MEQDLSEGVKRVKIEIFAHPDVVLGTRGTHGRLSRACSGADAENMF